MSLNGVVRRALLVGAILGTLTACGNSSDAPAAGASNGNAAAAAPAPKAHPGEDTYRKFCISCHLSGAAGAPKLGDVAAWAPRIAKGNEYMLQRVIDGVPPGMPPRGICATCTDAQLLSAVEYMVEKSQ